MGKGIEMTEKAKTIAKIRIGVDLMGNDNSPILLLDALRELSLDDNVEIIAIGTSEFEKNSSPFSYVIAPEVIGMEEHPLLALRKKRNSSISTGLRLVKEGKLNAYVSAGNTGALVSSAKMILSTLPGILRPCLLALMPTKKNPVAVLDVGANVQVRADHLVQFALIGAAFQKTRGVADPSVGLLNIGSEAVKGTSELRVAYHKLQEMNSFRFAGNIEGKTVFDGDVDVLVTDGFTGNVFLKTAEGIASLILDRIQGNSTELKKFKSLHYAEYPGALIAGVKGIVIKCHGYSTPKGFKNAVLGAIDLAKMGFVQKLLNDLI
ncbi:MAG: phosphate acyltransferase [Chlamydiae bacterium CG10_big_fil_rev_8_21_14_0_10_42_34]|nr:MAG: phosphate acyltransferase [Chlamydiae bacterium CG10_big_fil_rev_8_21_14_0_10_42_34]